MKGWILRILIFICTIALCVNFVRALVVPNGESLEPLDFRVVMTKISQFDVDAAPLFRDLLNSFLSLQSSFATQINAFIGLGSPDGILDWLSSLGSLLLSPVQIIVSLLIAVIDFIIFAGKFVYQCILLLNYFFNGILT